MFPTNGDLTDTGVGADFVALFELIDVTVASGDSTRGHVVTPSSIDLKISAGGGVVNRKLDLDINGVPFIDDSDTALFGQIGAGLQFPLEIIGLPPQTAFFIGVNHRVTGGLDLRSAAGAPFRVSRRTTTSIRANLIIFITPRISSQVEKDD